jgi:hypothetical protein
MPIAWLLASLLVISAAAPWSCAEPQYAVQPPEPGEATPEPVPSQAPPAEPVEPPELEPPAAPDDPEVPTPDPSAPCCYTNPSYSGTCEVAPTGDETCASILEYLNHPNSTGKLYCAATEIRGGWKPAACAGS